MLLRRLF
ncbi:uncharacterized protein FPRN_15257 [Fusarium proliferatum]|nr:uncharacterized protein FPRN_15257 [Fusarium proliferatum]